MKRRIDRQDIITAGLDLMFLNGYNATGIKDITDEVGIPKGSFYNHFKSKEDFGLEVLQFYSNRGVKMHEDYLINDKSKSPLERLNSFYSYVISTYKGPSDYKYGCIMSNFSAELGDVNEKFRAVLDHEFKEYERIIKNCLEEAKEIREINSNIDVHKLSSFILNSWHGALVRMKSTGTIDPLNNFKSTIFEILKK